MSPRNDDPEFDREGFDLTDPTAFEPKRTAITRGPLQRSKRIRTARRANTANGIERRRNKRLDW